MTPEAGKIVAEYRTPGGVVRISDAGFSGKTPEQRERDRQKARAVALEILGRAVERGAVEGITPEEWVRRYGEGGTDCRGSAGLAMTGGGSAPHPSPAATPSTQGEGFAGERSGVNG